MRGAAHGENFVRAFDGAGFFGDFLAVFDVEPLGLKRAQPVQHDFVDREVCVVGGVVFEQDADFVGEGVGGDVDFVTAVEIEQVGTKALFVDERVERAEKGGVFVIPDDHVAVRAQQHGAKRVVGVPKLHVGAVGGVADVEGVEHQQAAVSAIHDMLGEPRVPIAAHVGKVGEGEVCGFPFAHDKLGWPDLDPVLVIWGAIAKRRAA